ncbi:MAG TPA: hypothetical protein VFE34_12370 [Dongiaceae bacterium]|jgi:hypothetical protein|nr:hypothetical protein [Dongiaceae bacterium]
MSAATLTTAPAGRVRLGNLYVMIDGRPYQIVNMNIVDVLIAGAPDWIAPRQKLDFSFVLSLDGKERALPTFGVVVRNDAQGLEVRYNAPALRWRDILARLIAEDARSTAKQQTKQPQKR